MMTFDQFKDHVRNKAVYEAIYTDSEGRDILVITLLDAYVLMRQTDPPQRKPLTDEALVDIWADSQVLDVNHKINTPQHAFARAIEKAHGIE
jgi:hypothetical protein